MTVTIQGLLACLPPFRNKGVVIERRQTVPDIIREMVDAQKEFAPQYDEIALFFDAPTVAGICRKIYSFCKNNFYYKEETEDDQTTMIPAGILTRGGDPKTGLDCKHYSLFAAGILAALNRVRDRKIDWEFRFVSYMISQRTPYHVFVVVKDRGEEIWIDATPGAEGKTPVWQISKTVNSTNMPLRRIIAGVLSETDSFLLQEAGDTSVEIPVELRRPIEILLYYEVLTPQGVFDEGRANYLYNVLPEAEAAAVAQAMREVVASSGVIGGWLGDAFKAVKHFAAGMGMQVPRAAFIALVRLNAFDYGRKLYKATTYPDGLAKLKDLWYQVGGSWNALKDAINAGNKKGGGTGTVAGGRVGEVAAATAGVIASAAVIVAAIMPVISKLLDAKNANTPAVSYDPATGLPAGSGSGGFIQNNLPLILGAGALVAWWYYSGSKKKRA